MQPSAAGRFDMEGGNARSYGRPSTYASPQVKGELVEAPDLFTTQIELINHIVETVAYRNGLRDDLVDDFRSLVHEKLLENDQARLRSFGHRSSWKTYLTTVIANLARDFRNHLWGKWRPSAGAQNLGPDAVRLEMLLHRDGRPLEEAIEIAVRESENGLTPSEAHRLYGRLPIRKRRELVGLEAISDVPGADRPDDAFWRDEDHRELQRLGDVLKKALSDLPPEERVMIKMRYYDGFTLAAIGKVFGLTPQATDRRIRKALKTLRRHFD